MYMNDKLSTDHDLDTSTFESDFFGGSPDGRKDPDMRLVERLFQKDEATLPGIGQTITLPQGVLLRDYGPVGSLSRAFAETKLILSGQRRSSEGFLDRHIGGALDRLSLRKGSAEAERKIPALATMDSYCYPHDLNGTRVYDTAKKRGLDPSASVFADGHRSGILLARLDQRKVLQDLLEQAGIQLDSSKFEGPKFANTAGLLALLKAERGGVENLRLPIFNTRDGIGKILAAFGF
jgi:hypothetical protein